MTQQQKRIKLAEFDGFLPDPPTGFWYLCYGDISGFKDRIKPLPKYFEDLNSVREIENKLPKNQLGAYNTLLADFMEKKHKDDPNIIQGYARSMAISASAEERSETLGKFLNLW